MANNITTELVGLRCKFCGKVLLKCKQGSILEIEIKCPKCGQVNKPYVDTIAWERQ